MKMNVCQIGRYTKYSIVGGIHISFFIIKFDDFNLSSYALPFLGQSNEWNCKQIYLKAMYEIDNIFYKYRILSTVKFRNNLLSEINLLTWILLYLREECVLCVYKCLIQIFISLMNFMLPYVTFQNKYLNKSCLFYMKIPLNIYVHNMISSLCH